ncbi:Uncharacterised protein [Klebsiella pneumoniae]|nr:Uncharacterised protein [Klebsiella pneumoniae]
MVRAYHIAKALDPRRAVVARRRSKKAQRVIAPEVLQPAIEQMLVIREPVNRQQLHRGNAQAFDIVDRGFVPHPLKRPAQLGRNGRVHLGKPFHVALIDNGMRPGDVRPVVVLPVKSVRVDNPAFRRKRRAVAGIKAQIQLVMPQRIAEMGVVPVDVTHQFASVRVDEQLMRVKAMTVFRVVGAVDAIAVQRARLQVRHIAVPDLMGILRQLQPGDFRFPGRVKQTELHSFSVRGEQREVNALPVIIRPQLLAMTGPNFKRCILCHFRSPRLFAGKQNQYTSLF